MVWPDSISESLVEGAGLQQMFCCLTAITARALLCMADAEFGIQVIAEAVVACPKSEHCHLFPSGLKVVGGLSCAVGAGASTCYVAWP